MHSSFLKKNSRSHPNGRSLEPFGYSIRSLLEHSAGAKLMRAAEVM